VNQRASFRPQYADALFLRIEEAGIELEV